MDKKAKVFSLIGISGAMLFSFAIIGKNFDFLGARAANFGEPIDSSITFQRDQTFKSLGDNKYSVRGITPNNTTIYAIIDCSIQPASNFMAVFPALASSSISDTKINFSIDENGNEPFIFQKINKLNFTFDSGSAAICIASYNSGTYTYGNPINFNSGIDGPDSEFFTPNTELKIKGASGEDRQRFERKLKSLTLSFTCDYNYIPPVEHNVSAASTTNGSIQLQQTIAFKNDEVKFSVIPDSGYYASSVSTSNPDVVPEPHDSYYSFIMPDSDIEVRATFKPVPAVIHTVSIRTSTGGSVTSAQSDYYENESVVLTAHPSTGYEIDTIVTDPSTQVSGSGNTYSFNMPNEDIEVIPTFKKCKYQLSLDSYEHGIVTNFPSGLHEMGDLISFNVSADSGYEINKVTYNDTEIQGSSGAYSFIMPADAVTVKVDFKKTQSKKTLDELLLELNRFKMNGSDSTYWIEMDFANKTETSYSSSGTRSTVWNFTYSLTNNNDGTYTVNILSSVQGAKVSLGFAAGVNTLVSGQSADNYFIVNMNGDESAITSIVLVSTTTGYTSTKYTFSYNV